jgi:hypothetical protein
LSASQKELLLWHQCLSHASVKWVQKLIHDRKWLPGTANNKMALHSGPFITTRKGSRAQLCDTSTLICAACLYAKASTRSPTNLAPRSSPKKNILKQNHLQPGNCLSADHYFSPIPGRLPHNKFVWEQNGYTCDSLLWIMQVEKYSTFPNIPTLLWRLSKVHFRWRQWLRKKVFVSKHITRTMAFLLQLNSSNIVHCSIRITLSVVLGLNTRTALTNATLKQLRNGHEPTYSI